MPIMPRNKVVCVDDFSYETPIAIPDEGLTYSGEGNIRKFNTGATRDTDRDKLDYHGFLSPIVLKRYAEYLHKHRIQSDGNYRESDNWKRGIPLDTYIKSGLRHFIDWWLEHDGYESREGIEDALCGLIFNAMGYLFEYLKKGE